MSRIRAFGREHIGEVARLHHAVFRPHEPDSAAITEAYHAYFTGVFLASPVSDPSLPSLVCEDDHGRVVGFIGVVSRTVITAGRRLRAAVSGQFVVDPAGPAGLVAVRLAKAFLDGPQDLSISDGANDAARGIWERLGGTTDRWLSLHWTRPLRPARLVLSLLGNRRAFAPLAAAAVPLAAIADGVAARVPSSHFRQARPRTAGADLDTAQMVAHELAFSQMAGLRVEYDERAFAWLLERAAKPDVGGRLRKTVVARNQHVLGWYIWHLDSLGKADVLQLAATTTSIDEVLEHLFYDAWQEGAVEVTGRLEPRFMQALSDKYCLFHRRGPWTLVHARRPEVLLAFSTGNAAFSRLDGEWPLAFSTKEDKGQRAKAMASDKR